MNVHSLLEHVLSNLLDLKRSIRAIGLGTRKRLKGWKWREERFLPNAVHRFVTGNAVEIAEAGVPEASSKFFGRGFFHCFWFDRLYTAINVFFDCVHLLAIQFLTDVSGNFLDGLF